MAELPTVLMGDQVYAALKMLGIRREDCDQVREVHINPHRMRVTMYRLNEDGHLYVLGDGEAAVEATDVGILWAGKACTCPDVTQLGDHEPRTMLDPTCPIHGEAA